MVSGYLWGKNAVNYLAENVKKKTPIQEVMSNAVWQTETLFREGNLDFITFISYIYFFLGTLFNTEIIKKTYSKFQEQINSSLVPDSELSKNMVQATLFVRLLVFLFLSLFVFFFLLPVFFLNSLSFLSFLSFSKIF